MPSGRRDRRGSGDRGAHGAHDGRSEPERIELVADDLGGVTVVLDGSPQSHVHPGDPGLLVFEYVAHLALLVDATAAPAPAPLAVTHVGGAAMTLARWVEHTRPGSPQVVLEPDAALTELVRRELPLPRRHRIRVRPVDGLTGTAALADASADVVVVDAFDHGRVPAELTTTGYLGDVARVLRPAGVVLLNLADEPGLRYVARVVASLSATGAFAEVVLVATQEVLKGRRFGNAVLAASPARFDVPGLAAQVARSPFPTGLRHGADVQRMARSARPLTEQDAAASPTPPDPGRWRVR